MPGGLEGPLLIAGDSAELRDPCARCRRSLGPQLSSEFRLHSVVSQPRGFAPGC